MSEEMDGHAGTEGGEGKVRRAVWKEENRNLGIAVSRQVDADWQSA